MKIHIISETEFFMKATGVHTAFIDHVALLREKNDVEVVVNEEGSGDICHGHTYGLYYLWTGRKYKGKRVFTVHVTPDSIKGSLPFWRTLMPAIKLGLKFIYSYSDVCIAISPEVEKAIIESGARTRIFRLYNPIRTSAWQRSVEKRNIGRKLLGVEGTEFVVIGSGQMIGRKGIEDFIDIASEVPDARFVWVGGRPFGKLSEGITRIDNKIETATSNFKYAGSFGIERMSEIYSAADLMLFPSFQENCPLAPIEAAANGMPVIFRDIPEYKSLYENPYLSAINKADFVTQTKRMMTDTEYYNRGLQISNQLLAQFDKDEIRRKLITLYEDLIYQSTNYQYYRGYRPKLSVNYKLT
jgi:1,2-diacylglycerol-3-alpha-glucose alpha-1,2-galactosyltransferase